ncbi:MAG: hypothetical protein RL685_46 [Pseudomonadota bacterium]|jgi:CheY-like chemotaxis protein
MTGDLPPELDASRERFIAELGERLSALRQSLARFASASEPAGELNALRRRVHALAASADVLRFTRAAEALASAETSLAGAGGWDPGPPVRERVARILDLLPSLVLGAPIDLASELDNPRLEPLREPLCVVVYADSSLESLLHGPGKPGSPQGIESHATRQPEQAVELVTQLSPDVLLVDGDDPDVSEILPRLRQASGARGVVVVAVGSFERHEPLARLMRRGVSRVLPKPTDALTLQRTLRQVTQSESSTSSRAQQQRRPSNEQLLDALAQEARRAVREPAATSPGSPDPGPSPALQAAAWGALARLRALGARQGQGLPSFSREGPGGSLLLAPDAPPPSGESSRPGSTPVPLAGRRLVVADDDPAIRTLLSNALAELGATVLPARDGAEALDLAERHWPDALVSDTLMPELDGFELCRRLRQDIALSDLPVLLVAWREHLLECTRTNSTRKALEQIDGTSLAQALRECLAPRVALEQRLAQHDAVHGRLDGLTPRLLLQMVCDRSPHALLSLRSGRLTFEFSIADGKPLHARWYDADQPRGEGKCVLVPFLGIRTGRFSVEPLFSPPLALFEGDAKAVLNPAAVRARRAREQVSPRQLREVARVVLDPLATEHYLAEFPAAAALVGQLGSGDALRRLSEEDAGGGEPGRLPALLAELASHGVIGALLDRQGNDLLPGGPAFRPGSTPPGSARRSSRPAPSSAATAPSPSASERPHAAEALPASTSALEPERDPAAAQPRAGSQQPGSQRPVTQRFASPSKPFISDLELTPSPGKPEPPPPDQLHFADERPVIQQPVVQQPVVAEAAAAPGADGERAARLSAPPAAIEQELESIRDAATTTELDPESAGVEELDSAWPPRPAGRARAAFGRVLLSLAAAAIAFLGIRALAFRWETRSAPAPSSAPAPAALLSAPGAGATSTPQALTPALTPGRANDAGGTQRRADSAALAPPLPVSFESELIDLAPGSKLPPGQGLLEVHSWQRQHIYVDGVFMGNYESRLIPLGPGTYQLRLSDGARDIDRPVEVQAGRRTRVSARPSAAP